MSSHTAERQRLGTLQRNYRRAWASLIREAEVLQRACKADENSTAVSEARARVEAAAKSYRVARNELAQILLDDRDRDHARREGEHSDHEPVLAAACCAQ